MAKITFYSAGMQVVWKRDAASHYMHNLRSSLIWELKAALTLSYGNNEPTHPATKSLYNHCIRLPANLAHRQMLS